MEINRLTERIVPFPRTAPPNVSFTKSIFWVQYWYLGVVLALRNAPHDSSEADITTCRRNVQRENAGSAKPGEILATLCARWARRQWHQSSRGMSRRDPRFTVILSLGSHHVLLPLRGTIAFAVRDVCHLQSRHFKHFAWATLRTARYTYKHKRCLMCPTLRYIPPPSGRVLRAWDCGLPDGNAV